MQYHFSTRYCTPIKRIIGAFLLKDTYINGEKGSDVKKGIIEYLKYDPISKICIYMCALKSMKRYLLKCQQCLTLEVRFGAIIISLYMTVIFHFSTMSM